ncbi:Polysaccharide export protein [gamma proteobacterium HdN1]|nr:Polysaccharide export protein [gamma proteobacterium HdN1]
MKSRSATMIKAAVSQVLFLLSALLIAGCAGNRPVSAPVQTQDYSEQTYQIGVGDQLQISVWREPELSVAVPVRPDGKVSVPLAGDVLAAGETAESLAAKVAEKLANFVRQPQVTVIVSDPVSRDFQQRVRATGALQTPTSVPFRKGMTVLDLVLLSGGTTPFADANGTQLYRQTKDGVRVYPIRLDDILKKGRLTTNYPLAPSDVVTVPERSF